MSSAFQRQVQFTCNIKAGGRVREFNFLKLNKVPVSFQIDVANDGGQWHLLILEQQENTWEIKGENLPKWIAESRSFLFQHASGAVNPDY
jgi:hypothetical protein